MGNGSRRGSSHTLAARTCERGWQCFTLLKKGKTTMRSRLAFLAVCAWFLANSTAGLCDTITLNPKIFPLSSLNLITGMVFDGKSIWVGDEGKQLVRLDANYAIAQRIKVNFTSFGVGGDGAIYAADEKTISQIPRGTGTVKKIPGIGIDNCSQGTMTASGPFIWILIACKAKSDSSSPEFNSLLLRINPKTGERDVATLAPIGDGGNQLLVSQGKVWANVGYCSVVDEKTLLTKTIQPARATSVDRLAANASKIYIVASGSNNGPQSIVAIDPNTFEETARTTIDDFIVNMIADEKNVIAFGQNQINVLSASDLSLERVIKTQLVQFHADWATILNGDLLIADDELGVDIPNRLLLFHDWRPGGPSTSAPK